MSDTPTAVSPTPTPVEPAVTIDAPSPVPVSPAPIPASPAVPAPVAPATPTAPTYDPAARRAALHEFLANANARAGAPAVATPEAQPAAVPAEGQPPSPTPAPALAPAPVTVPGTPAAPAPVVPPAPPVTAAPAPAAPTATPAPAPTPTVEDLQKEIEALKAAVAPPEAPAEGEVYLPKSDAELDAMVRDFSQGDPECRALKAGYDADLAALQKIAVYDAGGFLAGGELHKVEQQIVALNHYLDPARLKDLGIEAEPDEMQTSAARSKLTELRSVRLELQAEAQALQQRNALRADRYDARRAEFSNYVVGKVESVREAAEREEQIETDSRSFDTSYRAAYEAERARYPQIPAEHWPTIWANVRNRAWAEEAQDRDTLGANLQGWMGAAVKTEVDNLVAFHRTQSAIYAQQKRTDAAPAAPPTPAAAVIPQPAKVPGANFESESRARFKAFRQNVQAARRARVG